MEKTSKKLVKKGGRPPLPDGEAKIHRLVGVRFSASELEILRAKAADSGKSWTDWVRGRLGL